MNQELFGEFMGTLVLILLGNGVVAGVLLRRSKAEDAGWIVITAGWALAVMSGVLVATACGAPGQLNPAVTLGAAVVQGNFGKLVPYAVAQILGAIVGATLVWLHYLPHWRETPDADRKLACFSTGPAIRNPGSNLLSEIIGTFVLILVAGASASKGVLNAGMAPGGFLPFLVGCIVWAIGLSLGGPTGYAINPARDLGPRIAHALLPIAKKGPSDWSYAPIPIIGPLIGGALAGAFLKIAHFG